MQEISQDTALNYKAKKQSHKEQIDMDEKLKERAENYIRCFTSLHNQLKTALITKTNSTAMKLLEQCQKTAQELAGMVETETPKAPQVIPSLEDYCELVYLINEEIWHGERVNPGKVYRYMNKCLTMMGESLGLKSIIETGIQEEKKDGKE